MKLLHVQGLTKVYSGRAVVNSVDFEVHSGEIVGLLGPNGAGKTTAFRMTIGMISPTRGKVFFHNEDITRLPMYLRARRGIGYLSQDPSIFQRLTVRQNVLAVLETMKHTRGERMKIANQLLEELGLTKVIRNRAYTLSGGERRRLEISRALATNPSLILLDEPFSGVDPKAVSDIQVIITQLRNRGIGILLTDHNVRDTLEVTNRAYIIHDGKILTSGMPEQIVKDPLAKEFYLGQKFEDMEFKWPTGN